MRLSDDAACERWREKKKEAFVGAARSFSDTAAYRKSELAAARRRSSTKAARRFCLGMRTSGLVFWGPENKPPTSQPGKHRGLHGCCPHDQRPAQGLRTATANWQRRMSALICAFVPSRRSQLLRHCGIRRCACDFARALRVSTALPSLRSEAQRCSGDAGAGEGWRSEQDSGWPARHTKQDVFVWRSSRITPAPRGRAEEFVATTQKP